MASIASILIDGSILEGGGQLLRNSVALSALLSKPISIHKIRNGRKPPGLRKQHEAGIKLAAEISSATLIGAQVTSTTIEFAPGSKGISLPGNFAADPGTAGSTTLLLQVSLPCLLFSASSAHPSTLTLRGGTNASMAPQIDYTQNILFPFLHRYFGLRPSIDVQKRGYFPRGGGKVFCEVPPVSGPLPAFTLIDRGEVTAIRGQARVGGLPAHLARKMRDSAHSAFCDAGYDPSLISIESVREKDDDIIGSGGGIVIWAETNQGCRIAGSGVSSKGKDAGVLGREAAVEVMRGLEAGGCVDEYLQDQIIIFMALAEGKSAVKTGPLTLHTRTAIWVAEHLTAAKFSVQQESSGGTILSCEGIGFKALHPSQSSVSIPTDEVL